MVSNWFEMHTRSESLLSERAEWTDEPNLLLHANLRGQAPRSHGPCMVSSPPCHAHTVERCVEVTKATLCITIRIDELQ